HLPARRWGVANDPPPLGHVPGDGGCAREVVGLLARQSRGLRHAGAKASIWSRLGLLGARSQPSRTPGSPRPEEVVAAHGTEGVEHFAADVESWMPSVLHRLRMHLRQTDAAAR